MKKNIEDSVEKELKRDRLVACVKAAGGVIIPIATLASLAGIAYSLSHAFEDKYLAGFIPSLCAVGMAPKFSAYPEI
ncbi:hypothetical protein KAH94_06565, partial [bacterium]|nr:hypothetical protein [bacterium]